MSGLRKLTRSNSAWACPDAFQLYSEGHGYRMVATRLADLGVWTTRGSVERLIKRRPPYQEVLQARGLD